MLTEPKIDQRNAQPYVGIRTQVPMQELSRVIPEFTGEVFGWLAKHNTTPAGAPFMRYHVINMADKLDIEIGVPVASGVSGDDRVSAGVLPAGQYASLVYTGIENGYKGNAALLDWGAKKGLVWDNWQTEKGDAFGARYESFLTNPDDEPDMAKWQTEVAIRLKDE